MKAERGFSLIEAMVAIVVLTVSLLALAQLITLSVQRYSFARYDTKAIHVAEAKVEELKAVFEWQIETSLRSELLTAGTHGPILVAATQADETSGESNNFWVSWVVTDMSGGLKRVAVTVSPPNPNAAINQIMTVSSIFAP